MKETRMPPAESANLVANSGNTIYGVSVIVNESAPVDTKAYVVIETHQSDVTLASLRCYKVTPSLVG